MRASLLCVLIASLAAVLSPNASAETVPYTYCRDLTCNVTMVSTTYPCYRTSWVCDREISFTHLSDGIPEPVMGDEWKCNNCASYNGKPCTANDPGGTEKKCTFNLSERATLESEASLSGGPNVEVLLWKVQFEGHIGRSWTDSVEAIFSDEVLAPHCHILKGHGVFSKLVDARLRVNIVHSQTTTYGGPAWCAGQRDPRECNRSTVIVEYDESFYGVELRTDVNNTCEYENSGGR